MTKPHKLDKRTSDYQVAVDHLEDGLRFLFNENGISEYDADDEEDLEEMRRLQFLRKHPEVIIEALIRQLSEYIGNAATSKVDLEKRLARATREIERGANSTHDGWVRVASWHKQVAESTDAN